MYLNVGFLFPVERSMAELWINVVIKSFGLGEELSTLDMNEGVLLAIHSAEKGIYPSPDEHRFNRVQIPVV